MVVTASITDWSGQLECGKPNWKISLDDQIGARSGILVSHCPWQVP